MNIEVKEDIVFAPIELKIIIETPEELCDLWHRINLNPSNKESKILIRYPDIDVLKHRMDTKNLLYGELSELIKKHKLFK